jgi:hypothetical protein
MGEGCGHQLGDKLAEGWKCQLGEDCGSNLSDKQTE